MAVGATVIVTDVSKNLLESLVSPAIHTFRLDVLDAAAITSAAAEAGPINILFNCAGFLHQGIVLDATEAEWDFALDLNVYLMFRTIRAFLPGMLDRQSGSIGDMSSAARRIKGAQSRFVYATSKAAVLGLPRSVAADYVTAGIRCNAICPGTVQRPSLNDRVAANAATHGSVEASRAAFIARQAMGRLGTSEEIAVMAMYLARDDARFVTGQAMVIDGGWTL